MDYDRKSTVSSFYGGRRSQDALNSDFPTTSPTHFDQPRRSRVDSASSFYNPNGASKAGNEMFNGAPSAGYNRSSFFYAGREEPLRGGVDEESMLSKPDNGFNIYADFNNQGPRYSTAFGVQDTGYRQVPSPMPHFKEEEPQSPSQVELVTVPALGPEWKASELRDMTSRAKREKALESFSDKWNAWNRGERGMCGPYFTRRTTTYVVFGLCVCIGIVLAFTIPRVPDFYFPSTDPLSAATYPWNDTVPTIFSVSPTNFSFPAEISLQFDTSSSFLPVQMTKMQAYVYDLETDLLVGTGKLSKVSLPAKEYPIVTMPLNFTYVATNDSDITWINFYYGCRNPANNANDSRPVLQFNFDLDMYILGLVGKRTTSAAVTEADCPITLSESAEG